MRQVRYGVGMSLDAYIAEPKDFIKGNKMAFPGIKKAEERADVIAYLKTATGE